MSIERDDVSAIKLLLFVILSQVESDNSSWLCYQWMWMLFSSSKLRLGL